MKNKYRILAGIMSLTICTSLLVGCSSENTESKDDMQNSQSSTLEKEESVAISFDFIGGKDVMPIGGFYGPYDVEFSTDGMDSPDYYTDEIMQLIAEAGINLISASADVYSGNGTNIKKVLELGEKYGVGYMINDGRVSKDSDVDYVRDMLADYYTYPAFCGIRITDEPTTDYYQLNHNIVSSWSNLCNIYQNELDLTIYYNALPIYDWMGTRETYERYIQEIIDTCSPNILMWDHYPFDTRNYEYYFMNMDVIYQFAKEYNLPFWSFIQAGGHWGSMSDVTDYYPNEAEFDWNVNTSLAMGAQGIQYFPLIQPNGDAYSSTGGYDSQRCGLIGLWGNKTRWYYYAQNINEQIAAVDEVLMNSVHKGIIVKGEQAIADTKQVSCIIESGSFQELNSVDGDVFIGCFNYNGKTALYVVNYSMEYAQNITLHFDGNQKIKVVQNAETNYVEARNLTLDMAAGEGVLLVIE